MSTRFLMNRNRRHRKGSAIMEFALCMPMVFLLLFGTADFGRLYYTAIEVQNAAAAGASYGSLSSSNMTDTAGITAAAQNDAPDISGLQVAVSQVCKRSDGDVVSCSTSGTIYQYVSVTASYTFQTFFKYPYIPQSVTLSKTVMMRGA